MDVVTNTTALLKLGMIPFIFASSLSMIVCGID